MVNMSMSQSRKPRPREVAACAQDPRAGIQDTEAWPQGQSGLTACPLARTPWWALNVPSGPSGLSLPGSELLPLMARGLVPSCRQMLLNNPKCPRHGPTKGHRSGHQCPGPRHPLSVCETCRHSLAFQSAGLACPLTAPLCSRFLLPQRKCWSQ